MFSLACVSQNTSRDAIQKKSLNWGIFDDISHMIPPVFNGSLQHAQMYLGLMDCVKISTLIVILGIPIYEN